MVSNTSLEPNRPATLQEAINALRLAVMQPPHLRPPTDIKYRLGESRLTFHHEHYSAGVKRGLEYALSLIEERPHD